MDKTNNDIKTTPYSALADSEEEFDQWLKRTDLHINKNDRIHEAYIHVSRMAEMMKLPEGERNKEFDKYLNEFKSGEPIQALLDIQEIYDAIPFFAEVDIKILAIKLKNITKGSLIRASENINNPLARNTQFELSLFSRLRRAGFDAVLCEPRPDIKVRVGKKEYFIECKRMIKPTHTSVKSNIKDALVQLNKEVGRLNLNQYGIVAISVQRVFSEPSDYLSTDNHQSGLAFIQELTKEFIMQNCSVWQNTNRLKNTRIASVWVHYSGGLDTKVPPYLSFMNNITLTNTWKGKKEFDTIKSDFELGLKSNQLVL